MKDVKAQFLTLKEFYANDELEDLKNNRKYRIKIGALEEENKKLIEDNRNLSKRLRKREAICTTEKRVAKHRREEIILDGENDLERVAFCFPLRPIRGTEE